MGLTLFNISLSTSSLTLLTPVLNVWNNFEDSVQMHLVHVRFLLTQEWYFSIFFQCIPSKLTLKLLTLWRLWRVPTKYRFWLYLMLACYYQNTYLYTVYCKKTFTSISRTDFPCIYVMVSSRNRLQCVNLRHVEYRSYKVLEVIVSKYPSLKHTFRYIR